MTTTGGRTDLCLMFQGSSQLSYVAKLALQISEEWEGRLTSR